MPAVALASASVFCRSCHAAATVSPIWIIWCFPVPHPDYTYTCSMLSRGDPHRFPTVTSTVTPTYDKSDPPRIHVWTTPRTPGNSRTQARYPPPSTNPADPKRHLWIQPDIHSCRHRKPHPRQARRAKKPTWGQPDQPHPASVRAPVVDVSTFTWLSPDRSARGAGRRPHRVQQTRPVSTNTLGQPHSVIISANSEGISRHFGHDPFESQRPIPAHHPEWVTEWTFHPRTARHGQSNAEGDRRADLRSG